MFNSLHALDQAAIAIIVKGTGSRIREAWIYRNQETVIISDWETDKVLYYHLART